MKVGDVVRGQRVSFGPEGSRRMGTVVRKTANSSHWWVQADGDSAGMSMHHPRTLTLIE